MECMSKNLCHMIINVDDYMSGQEKKYRSYFGHAASGKLII